MTEPCPPVPGNVLDRGRGPGMQCTYRGASGYGAVASGDLLEWDDVSAEVDGLRGGGTPTTRHKHGTAIRLGRGAACAICAEAERTRSRELWAGSGVLERCGACP